MEIIFPLIPWLMPSQMNNKILNSTGQDFSKFLLVWKTYSFELILDSLSDFTKIGSDHLQTMLAKMYGIQID